MNHPLDKNRLSDEKSPYLQQHADDPVNWQPWDKTAFSGAKERDVPIFVSIGYSACHWCHVMREESFSDEEVASILNKKFVPIKVDREERPDIDQIYQKVCQMVTGQGGWPLSVWLTPNQEPFYVGTYYPKKSKHGRVGLIEVLKEISKLWNNKKEEILEKANEIKNALKSETEELQTRPEEPKREELLLETAEEIFELADLKNGGFGRYGPKFPQTSWIDILLTAYYRSNRSEYKETALKTLDAMMKGGIRDHIGGGFHRYSTDPKWTVPHFEKMLYDNALLPGIYISAYQLTGENEYLKIAQETFEFVERELTHPSGAFYSSLDARSEGEEGKFYVWKPEEIRKIIEDKGTEKLFLEYFGLSKEGNFEGKNVLRIKKNTKKLASKYNMDKKEVRKLLEKAKKDVFRARKKRLRPLRDEKILAGWNGLMISALAKGARLLGKRYEERAKNALNFLKDLLWDENKKLLYRRYKDGETTINGFLEDYAYLSKGAFELYQTTGEIEYLRFSRELCRSIIKRFWDEENSSLFYTDSEGEELMIRPQELTDSSKPSSTGIATTMLLNLSPIFPEEKFGEVAEIILKNKKSKIKNRKLEHSSLILAMDLLINSHLEVIMVGNKISKEWKHEIEKEYLPNKILLPRPETEKEMEDWLKKLQISETPPIWKNRTTKNNKPTLYICGSKTCSPPVNEVKEGLKWAKKLS